jgi:lipopolysaccharide/colanic/teichoic acid biosynthesis glycosyltransferase
MLKRLSDLFFAGIGIIFLFIPSAFIALWIIMDSRGGVFYTQQRIGWKGRVFKIYKFRTMRPAADAQGLLTVGNRDQRITKVGYYLRKYKLDEIPQLINVLLGDMSIVGPRPEVERFVKLYDDSQKRILNVRPGLTDYASLQYINENEILSLSLDAENTYITEIMPHKLKLGLKYIDEQSLLTDWKIIVLTFYKILRP